MLTDSKEIQIISKARQKNVRDPNRSREHFHRIFKDFFKDVNFNGGDYIDLGAGQFDFCEIIKSKNGICTGVDNDQAVIALGKHKGFNSVLADIKRISDIDFMKKFDGVFNKFTLNAFWFWSDDNKHARFIDNIVNLLKPDGWAWIAPWNGIPKNVTIDQSEIARVLAFQKMRFEEHGFESISLTKTQSKYYGINGIIENNIVFLKNLYWRG
jgi:SAM-dependent methyltransferase